MQPWLKRGGLPLGVDVMDLIDEAPVTAWPWPVRGITMPWPNATFSASCYIIMMACWTAF
jgi:hypothetical protein